MPYTLTDIKEAGAVAVIGFALLLTLWFLLRTLVKASDRQTSAIHAQTIILLNLQEMVMVHEMRARGINPALGTKAEREAEAESIFARALKLLDEQRELLKQHVNGEVAW